MIMVHWPEGGCHPVDNLLVVATQLLPGERGDVYTYVCSLCYCSCKYLYRSCLYGWMIFHWEPVHLCLYTVGNVQLAASILCVLCCGIRVDFVCELALYQRIKLCSADPLTSARQHPSYGDCLEVKRKYYQNCSVLDCVTQCSQSAAHLCEQFLQVKQIGFVTLGPIRCT